MVHIFSFYALHREIGGDVAVGRAARISVRLFPLPGREKNVRLYFYFYLVFNLY